MLHVPVLRAGKPYKSLSTVKTVDFRSGEQVAELSQANSGLIHKDFSAAAANKRGLEEVPVNDLLAMCKAAAKNFSKGTLNLDGEAQSPQAYIDILSATTGMPRSLCWKNMEKVDLVLDQMTAVLGGLTRGLDLAILDQGWGSQHGRALSYQAQTDTLGAVLPNNSPGVHTLWLPSIPLKVPVVLKPGSQEPWTPYRVIQAFIASGCPPEAFSFYPTDYSGVTEILMRSGRSMLFGDVNTVRRWSKDHRVQIHGPGWSKIVVGEDQIDNWQQYVDVMADSIVANSGRSCLNTSGIWVPRHGREIAEHLAARLAGIEAQAMEDPDAQLAAFVNPLVAERVSELIDNGLKQGGAEEVTAKYRRGGRLVRRHGATYLLPTIIWCSDVEHPLANTELLFPFASVVELPQDQILQSICSTLVLTAITADRRFVEKVFAATNVDRLNLGPIPTMRVNWDQPHEGNLFEHLYKQRAFQSTG
jgi:acyl-CoA reductase-like NAD-dependent aldehyde dehydrogenase